METLMDCLVKHEVYHVKQGRVLDPQDSPVPDVLSTGLAALLHGNLTNPLAEFNMQFDRLRERHKLLPISTLLNNLTVPMSNDPPPADDLQATIRAEVEPVNCSIEEIDEEGNPSTLAQHDDEDGDMVTRTILLNLPH
jgi:hypothetical protein